MRRSCQSPRHGKISISAAPSADGIEGRQGRAVDQNEVEESKCREFVDGLNRLAEHERYRYVGHVSELELKYLPEFLIKDRRTSKELHVVFARFAPDWSTVEKANLRILERRFAQDLRYLGEEKYHKYDIYLQTRGPPYASASEAQPHWRG